MVPKRALVTGGSGQDGFYLVRLLRERGYEVHAQARGAAGPAGAIAGVSWHFGDLRDSAFFTRLFATAQPDEIYNLAAVSRPRLSWDIPLETGAVNAMIPQQIFEFVRRQSPQCRVYQASSSEIFGDCEVSPQNENTACRPQNPYAIAKLYAHQMAAVYRRQFDLFICAGILFNHESPLRSLHFVSQKVAHAAALVSLGMRESSERDERGEPILSGGIVQLGNLDVSRDFGYAGDYVEAIWRMLQSGRPDDYVIGTGASHTIRDFCELAFAHVGRDWRDHVRVDERLIRPLDSHKTVADTTKASKELGWRAKTSFRSLVHMMVDAQVVAFGGSSVSP